MLSSIDRASGVNNRKQVQTMADSKPIVQTIVMMDTTVRHKRPDQRISSPLLHWVTIQRGTKYLQEFTANQREMQEMSICDSTLYLLCVASYAANCHGAFINY